MSRRYDQSTTTFSPEGRLHQVEYAIEAINNAGTCVGIVGEDGIVLAAEKRVVSKLLAVPPPSKAAVCSEKMYPIDKHVCCLVAGYASDANTLIQQARLESQRYLYRYQEPIPVEQIVKRVCNYKQSYTQYGGLRPFGVGFLIAGYDQQNGYQLYQTDPSGNFTCWRATVIGQNNQAGKSILKSDYTGGVTTAEEAAFTTNTATASSSSSSTTTTGDKKANTIENNIELALKVLLKTMDTSTPSPDRVEVTVLKCEQGHEPTYTIMSNESVKSYLDKVQAVEDAKKKKETATSGNM